MRRALWLLILAPPVLAWLALAALTLAHVPRKVHTGDALIDTVLPQIFDWDANAVNTPSLTAGQRRALLMQFHGDPRFWWLCYEFHIVGEGMPVSEPDECLIEARRRGAVNSAIFYALYQSNAQELNKCLSGMPNAPAVPQYPATPQAWSQYFHARRIILDQSHKDHADDLLAEMQACAPQCATPFYLQALLAGEREQYETAYKLLRRGNALAAQSWRTVAAYDDNINIIDYSLLNNTDPLLAKYLASTFLSKFEITEGEDQWKAEALAYDAMRLQRWDIVRELHKMGCYLGILHTYRWLPVKLGMQACRHIQKEAARQPGVAANPAAAKALTDLGGELSKAYAYGLSHGGSMLQTSSSQAMLLDCKFSLDTALESVMSSLSRGCYARGNGWLGIIHFPSLKSYLMKQPAPGEFERTMDEMYAKLLSFDYTTFSFHDPPQPPARQASEY